MDTLIPLRDCRGHWLPGVSGNPGAGNPIPPGSELSLRIILDKYVPESDWARIVLVQVAAALAGDRESAKLLIEARWGKPRVRVDVDIEDTRLVNLLSQSAQEAIRATLLASVIDASTTTITTEFVPVEPDAVGNPQGNEDNCQVQAQNEST